ncbi:MAG: hypothetical protein ACOZQL_41805 [Myxococcota bacterium]
MTRWGGLALLLAACATTGASLHDEAPRCESFASFDARVRTELDALLREAPGDRLVHESSRLNLARRTCARHVLSELRSRRETDGLEAVQRELDALSATYAADELRALLTAALGDDAAQLEPLLQEARQRTTRVAGAAAAQRRDDDERSRLAVEAPESMGPAPSAPDTMCDEPTPCAQLDCVLKDGAPFELPARRCLDTLAPLEPWRRADALSVVLLKLPAKPGPARSDALSMLQTLERQLWPEVDAALLARHPGRAAQLANAFRGLPARRDEVARLREAALAHHLARATELASSPAAAWLHRKLAEGFGGPPTPDLDTRGRWEPLRWRCKADQPTLPALPGGLSAILSVRCDEPPKRDARPDALRTFELEREMSGQRVRGSLTVACADRTNLFTVQAEDLATLPAELSRLVDTAVGACARIHTFAATRSCAELRRLTPAAVIERFVGHQRFTHRWEPCFVEWMLANEGVSPP